MDTLLLNSNSYDNMIYAAKLIRNGDIVGMPTETVYGLAADARNENAVANIFKAKGRPSDNPLIVHLSDFSEAVNYTSSIPGLAYKLAEKFCPGPLTMILPKNNLIPYITSGGLDTVGIRIPAHETARELIRLSGCPIAAPSANTSGYPSPTSARHVMDDMNGKIPAIIDGGNCKCGVESTVISFDDNSTVRILRPGFITPEDLHLAAPNVIIDKAILHGVSDGEKVTSPGMKYKHYSPSAKVVLVDAKLPDFINFFNSHSGNNIYCLVFDGDEINFSSNCLTYGADSAAQAHNIFARLRELDKIGAEAVFVRFPDQKGIGLAVLNRLIRAAGFEVVKI